MLANNIQQLEEQLLQPEVRKSPGLLSNFLADDFVEIGSSGRIFNKQQVVDGVPSERPQLRKLTEFNIRLLNKDTVLATYRLQQEAISSWRSSIWKQIDGQWKMVFHQGTAIPTP